MISQRCNCWKRRAKSLDAILMLHQLRQGIKGNKQEVVDILYLFVLQGVNKFLPFLVIPYLMVKLGATGYGYIGFSLSVIQYLALIIDFGFDLSATKHLAIAGEDKQERTRIFWAVFGAKTMLLAASLLLLFILIAFVPTFKSYQAAILATTPMAIGSTYTFMWLFQGVGKVRAMAIINTISKLLLLPLIFIFVKVQEDYIIAALLQASVFCLTALISSIFAYRQSWIGGISWDFSRIKSEVSDSFPLFLSRASTSVYTQLFVIILGFFCSQSAVGRYTSAEALMRALCFIIYIPITQVFFPKISALSAKDRVAAVNKTKSVLYVVGGIMLLLTILLFVGASLLKSALHDEGYLGWDNLLRIISPAPLFIGIGAVCGQMGLIALGNKQSRVHFRNVYVITAVISIPAVSILTPLYAEYGAAWALLLSEAIVAALMFYYCKKDQVLCCSLPS